ncbi:phenolic acid decarboxylase [Chitinophaga sancti]|uniref:phenolic acid decarboxylase n=1 Tax=Chitinophaga sancti TaxID=1004 RepID=UPI002A74F36C|nr:phenolic acid decarboxylase [Chitinophaga sancti]WPQ62730.1 phenolic acid decarboxylase [Chitinophaga sancti]
MIDHIQLADDVYKIVWTEPTGTDVGVNCMPGREKLHGVIFFPSGVHEHRIIRG